MQNAVILRYTSLKIVGGSAVVFVPRIVLTSGHGVRGWAAGQLTVDLNDAMQTQIGVEKITRHPDPRVDIAALRLESAVEASEVVLLDRPPRKGERVWLGGYGIYGPPGEPRGVGRFHAGFNTITEVSAGRATIRFDADGVSNEALPGILDSGSPVWIETENGWALSGVTITATGRERPNFGDRSGHQLVAPIREWIDSIRKDDAK